MSDRFTLVGGRGFIGTALAAELERSGTEVVVRRHDESPARTPGHLVYLSGVAWGAEGRPGEAYALHVEGARIALETRSFESFTYVSSTRVYDGATSTNEDAILSAEPCSAAEVYRISKIAGENLTLALKDATARVVRLSNVFGPSFRSELFLSQILRSAAAEGVVRLRSSRASAKDYVAVGTVAELIPAIARGGRHRVYNVAAGANTTHGAIVDALVAASDAGVEIAAGAPTEVTPTIAVARVSAEFGLPRRPVVEAIPELYAAFVKAARRSAASGV